MFYSAFDAVERSQDLHRNVLNSDGNSLTEDALSFFIKGPF